ncbi:MAG: hypothetical protein ACM3ZE_25315 [Myxococcales bacterium]
MYASVADLRGEGVTSTEASDERLVVLIEEATQFIDRLTGWCFEPRTMSLRLNGRGSGVLELPVPPIRITRLVINEIELPTSPEDEIVFWAPIPSYFDGPRLVLLRGVFPRGHANVLVEGRFGYTEYDGTPEGRTPLAIRRACMLLVLRSLAPLTSETSSEARSRWRVTEERTRDQSFKLASIEGGAAFTGDPEIDALLGPYARHSALGAA